MQHLSLKKMLKNELLLGIAGIEASQPRRF